MSRSADLEHQKFFTICHKAEPSVLRFKKLSEYTQSAEFILIIWV